MGNWKTFTAGLAIFLVTALTAWGAPADAKTVGEVLDVPWLGTVDALKSVVSDAARAQHQDLDGGKSFEDYRSMLQFQGIPMDTAFMFYDDALFRVIMRYKNFKENDVISALNKLFGDPEGNSWTMIYKADDRTSVFVDTIDDTVTFTDSVVGTRWEVQDQKRTRQKGYEGQHGGG